LRLLVAVAALILGLATWALWPADAAAQDVCSGEHITAKLVTETKTVQPGTSFLAGIKFTIDEHWHIYWENPGENGLPTRYVWTLPAGWTESGILWPAPTKPELYDQVSYGYEGTFVLPARITVPADAPEGKAKIVLTPDWLVCHEQCLPCECGDLSLEVTVSKATPEPGADHALFEAARKLWAQPLPVDVAVEVVPVEKALELRVTGKGPWSAADAAPYVFALQETLADGKQVEVVNSNVPQVVRREGDVTTLTLPFPKRRKEPPPRLTGMFVVESAGTRLPFAIDVPVKGVKQPAVAAAVATPRGTETVQGEIAAPQDESAKKQEDDKPLWMWLILAFLGGAILNVMPCVLPVLSIKILGFVSQADEDPVRVRRHGYAFAVGVLVSFWILVGAIQAFKAAGEEVGWGFQLQYPGMIATLAALMVVVGINLFGVFEMGTSVMNLAGGAAGKIQHGGYSASFWSGMLATAIATPCTAPLMAPAVGYAMTAPAVECFLLFSLLGLGMATPYVLLTANPRLLKKVPRPGPWMETFKRVLAFPMFAVAAWLVGVLGKQTGIEGVAWMLYGLVTLGVGLWVYGHWGTAERPTNVRRLGYLFTLLFLGLGVFMIVKACQQEPKDWGAGASVEVKGPPSGEWEPWSPERVEAYVKAGYPVFVDFTADWCQVCEANENLFIDVDAVHAVVKKYKVAKLKADFTRKDPRIVKALKEFKRAGVPVYVAYSPAPGVPPEALPQVITTGIVVEAIERAATRPGVMIPQNPPPAPPNGK
jgi:thiol:disulfide interchange protein DsbD